MPSELTLTPKQKGASRRRFKMPVAMVQPNPTIELLSLASFQKQEQYFG